MSEPVTGPFFLDRVASDQSQTNRERTRSNRVRAEVTAEPASVPAAGPGPKVPSVKTTAPTTNNSHLSAADDLEGDRRRTRSRAIWAVVITGMALFMASLDNLVVTTALPVIREHLHAGLSGLEWTVNAYTLTFAVLLLVGCGTG